MQTQILLLNVAHLRPMENYRKAMDEKKMEELTESVRTKGVIQPILARPIAVPKDPGSVMTHEIVFGQRRWLASQRAGLETIPAMVRDVTDAEALELQVIENSQREDPNPMEEGIGFAKLLDMGKHTTETLAAKLDHSVDYVLGRLKLIALPKEVQDKMLSGEIAIGHALQLTRLKSEGEMKRLLRAILEEGMSVKDTAREIRQSSKEMSSALFDVAGCANCPSRTKTQSILFPEDAKGKDSCLDQSCFYSKTKAFWDSYASAMKAAGFKVILTEKATDECVRLATSRRLSLGKGDYSGETPKNRPQCMKCKEGRAFFCYERKLYDGSKLIEAGWICLNKACLAKMNQQPREKSGSASTVKPERNMVAHARAVRDRFIYAAMPARFEKSKTLQKRLAIYHLLGRFSQLNGSVLPEGSMRAEEVRVALLSSFAPGRDMAEFEYSMFNDDEYAVIAAIPEKDLDQAMTRVIQASLRHTNSEVLIRMAPEAGIVLEKEFKIDQTYLNAMTKDELLKFSKTLGVKALALDAEMKKPAMIEDILKHDLTGKMPKDVAEECALPGLDEICPKAKEKKTAKKK
jgi:ParB/RepB/Spo0J family partition protein